MGGSSGKQRWEPIRLPPGKTAIVTGGNTGIGYEVSKHLALMGCHVILACRSQQRAQAAILRMQGDLLEYKASTPPPFGYSAQDLPDEMNVEYLPLDLASLSSVMEFVNLFKEKGYPLDILICNAGIALVPQSNTEDGFEKHFQVMNMYSLVHRLEDTKITVNSVHPGMITTEIHRNFQDDNMWRRFNNLGKSLGIQKSAIEGAAGVINVAVNPHLDGMTGLYYDETVPATPKQKAKDPKAQEVLWRYSLECLKDFVTPDLLKDLTFDLSKLDEK